MKAISAGKFKKYRIWYNSPDGAQYRETRSLTKAVRYAQEKGSQRQVLGVRGRGLLQSREYLVLNV